MIEVRKCAECGWEWAKRSGKPEPKRCPNHGCRSARWMATVAEGLGWVEERAGVRRGRVTGSQRVMDEGQTLVKDPERW